MKLSVLYVPILIYLMLTMLQFNSGAENNLFPSAPTGVPDGDITYSLEHESTSDVILVKCPDMDYTHHDKLTRISLSKRFQFPVGYSRQMSSTFVWSAVRNPNPENKDFKVNCGSYNYRDSHGLREIHWNINIKWKNSIDTSKDLIFVDPVGINIDPVKNKCMKTNAELILVSIGKDKNLFTFEEMTNANSYSKQIVYFFDKDMVSRSEELVTPCGVAMICYYPPSIIIVNNKKYLASMDKKVKVVYSESEKSRPYKLKLMLGRGSGLENFYAGEMVSVQRMKYRDGNVEVINDTFFETADSFTINGYEILNFKYLAFTQGGKYVNVSETIFFGPKVRQLITPFEITDIGKDKKEIQANCSTERLSYGFLIAIEANNVTTKVKNSILDGQTIDNFEKKKNLFVYTITNKSQYIINCIYQTPDGTVKIRKVYIDKSKHIVHTDKYGNIKIIRNQRKIFFFKYKEHMSPSLFLLLFLLAGFIIIIISFLIYYFALRKMVERFFEEKRMRSRYPNIFHFWDTVLSQTLKEYSKIATYDKYVSRKLKSIKIIKHVENEDSNVINADNLFNSTLIKSYRIINGLIKAHYVKNVSPKRTYIISDGPRKHAIGEFFKMLFMEDVAVVVAIIYKDFNNPKANTKDVRYWPTKAPIVFENLTVEPDEDKNHKGDGNIRFSFRLFNESIKPKSLTIFHVSDWREYDLPSTKYLIELYKSVSECAGKRSVLVHNSYSVGPRVFIYTFFSCIFERMVEDNTIDNPMKVVKEIREQCFGGNITRMEFGYIVTALIKNFFEMRYLVGNEATKLKFFEDFDTYMYKSRMAFSNVSDEFNEMFKFLLASDRLKIAELINQCKRVQVDPIDVLEKKCQRYLAVSQSNYKDKLRYPGVYCLDNAAVYVSGFPKTDLRSFIHANEMIYDMAGGKKRKIIMCQAPVSSSIEDMLNVLYNYKVGIIVILVNPGELITKPPKWTKYLPYKEVVFKAGSYVVIRTHYKAADNNNISVMDCKIFCNTDASQFNPLRVYHYEAWPDKSVPRKTSNVLKLLRRVMNDPLSNRHIVIHCSAGIGRTGTFALALLMIDTVQAHGWFNPIKSLDILRKHRHRAVQTDSQFAFAIALVLHYFRKEIINIDKKLLVNFEELLKIYFD
uniref:Tyrosine-protein phosphatase domain-containing protein n=1 Tax=Parastrongyloides trichosuri TaxID=131310 RepID=A0A0N5A2N9_PARTI